MATDDLLIERLLRVIDEGRRTATHKLALLLAIIDTAATMPGQTELPTRAVAQRVLELYYPQTRSYIDGNGVAHMPRQISMKSSTVIAAVERLRLTGDAMRCRSLDEVATRASHDFARTLDVVEDTLVRYPIPLLQTVGSTVIPFLYAVDWIEGTAVSTLRRRDADRLRLLEGVTDRLVVLGPMLRPLIEHHWTQDVARWSRIGTEDEQLRSHLFGRDRATFPPPTCERAPRPTGRHVLLLRPRSTGASRSTTSSRGRDGRTSQSRTWSSPNGATERSRTTLQPRHTSTDGGDGLTITRATSANSHSLRDGRPRSIAPERSRIRPTNTSRSARPCGSTAGSSSWLPALRGTSESKAFDVAGGDRFIEHQLDRSRAVGTLRCRDPADLGDLLDRRDRAGVAAGVHGEGDRKLGSTVGWRQHDRPWLEVGRLDRSTSLQLARPWDLETRLVSLARSATCATSSRCRAAG